MRNTTAKSLKRIATARFAQLQPNQQRRQYRKLKKLWNRMPRTGRGAIMVELERRYLHA
jgi:hypothetical protein